MTLSLLFRPFYPYKSYYVRSGGVKRGVASNVIKQPWAAAEIYPTANLASYFDLKKGQS